MEIDLKQEVAQKKVRSMRKFGLGVQRGERNLENKVVNNINLKVNL
jgi:hypothetical protein